MHFLFYIIGLFMPVSCLMYKLILLCTAVVITSLFVSFVLHMPIWGSDIMQHTGSWFDEVSDSAVGTPFSNTLHVCILAAVTNNGSFMYSLPSFWFCRVFSAFFSIESDPTESALRDVKGTYSSSAPRVLEGGLLKDSSDGSSA